MSGTTFSGDIFPILKKSLLIGNYKNHQQFVLTANFLILSGKMAHNVVESGVYIVIDTPFLDVELSVYIYHTENTN